MEGDGHSTRPEPIYSITFFDENAFPIERAMERTIENDWIVWPWAFARFSDMSTHTHKHAVTHPAEEMMISGFHAKNETTHLLCGSMTKQRILSAPTKWSWGPICACFSASKDFLRSKFIIITSQHRTVGSTRQTAFLCAVCDAVCPFFVYDDKKWQRIHASLVVACARTYRCLRFYFRKWFLLHRFRVRAFPSFECRYPMRRLFCRPIHPKHSSIHQNASHTPFYILLSFVSSQN